MGEALVILFFLSPLLAVAGWGGTLWFGFSETGPKWLVLATFALAGASLLYFLIFGTLWLFGLIDPPTLTVGFE